MVGHMAIHICILVGSSLSLALSPIHLPYYLFVSYRSGLLRNLLSLTDGRLKDLASLVLDSARLKSNRCDEHMTCHNNNDCFFKLSVDFISA